MLLPSVSSSFDYEGELAVIIGKHGFHVPEDRALDIVAGYSLFNDGSIRDWQRHTSQFTPGKNFPSTAGFGPCLVTKEEAGPSPKNPSRPTSTASWSSPPTSAT
jgi:2-keto-4-pentenoate hydratase/2-oxohepta-3-ene-1,7-dioic acid hydratase in catechol pathway